MFVQDADASFRKRPDIWIIQKFGVMTEGVGGPRVGLDVVFDEFPVEVLSE
jgi:hypothetical protein